MFDRRATRERSDARGDQALEGAGEVSAGSGDHLGADDGVEGFAAVRSVAVGDRGLGGGWQARDGDRTAAMRRLRALE